MMLMKLSGPAFRFGFVLSSCSLEVHFGWTGFMWFWKPVLESLPQMEMGPCQKCGATDWTAANPSDDGKGFKDCNKCGGYPGGPR